MIAEGSWHRHLGPASGKKILQCTVCWDSIIIWRCLTWKWREWHARLSFIVVISHNLSYGTQIKICVNYSSADWALITPGRRALPNIVLALDQVTQAHWFSLLFMQWICDLNPNICVSFRVALYAGWMLCSTREACQTKILTNRWPLDPKHFLEMRLKWNHNLQWSENKYWQKVFSSIQHRSMDWNKSHI